MGGNVGQDEDRDRKRKIKVAKGSRNVTVIIMPFQFGFLLMIGCHRRRVVFVAVRKEDTRRGAKTKGGK